MSDVATILERARAWVDADPDPDTRAAGEALLRDGDEAILRDHFGTRLRFGTAGMRGAIGPGPNRMNRALVQRVTAGLGTYLLAVDPAARADGVVIGFDGRHGSDAFAADAAAVLSALGIPVFGFKRVCPTPRLAHAVTHMGAAAGIMVTASHNPPEDNGYKVYWRNGAQFVPPHDEGISASIDAVAGSPALRPGQIRPVPDAVWEVYRDQVLGLRVHTDTGVRAVYTALHGVGWATLDAVLQAAGHSQVTAVVAQRDPDGDFPTVRFPNPEEPGAMDMAIAQAKATGATLAIANDPDADRLAVAVPDEQGAWQLLSGNDVGAILAEDLLQFGPGGSDRLVATTIVSTGMLRRIATQHGVCYAETLTGFKWIANEGIDHDGPFVIGFEEALGYSVGSVVRDKDGISAALLILDLASHLAQQGRSLLDARAALHEKYGSHVAEQWAVKLPGEAGARRIETALADLRKAPPASIAGSDVVRSRDVLMSKGWDREGGEFTVKLPTSNVLEFHLADGTRVLARPSGTEPKIKFYVESVAASPEAAAARVAAVLDWLKERTGL